MKQKKMLPIARRKKTLVVQELPDEVLVYDGDCHKAYCLNYSTAIVWKHCDGKTNAREMAQLLEKEFNVSSGEDEVHQALGNLKKYRLVR